MSVFCGECGSPMELRNSRFGPFYGCTQYPECKGTHGAHPNGEPLGVPANSETKLARIEAHEAFDELWKSGKMTRKSAYKWLSKKLDKEAHIGAMSIEECKRVIEVSKVEKEQL